MSLSSFAKLVMLVGALVPLAFPPSAEAAAPKRRPPAKRPAPAPKPDPVKVLSYHLAANSLQPGENVAQACEAASFKDLAIALNMNADLLHQEKDEYETTAEFERRVSGLADEVQNL